MNETSILGYALLGLLLQKPRSGYDLRKIFTATPMRTFSDSPGAIYPALRRLEERGLVRSHVQERSGLRRRRLFRPTSAGVAEFKTWQTKAILRDDLIRRTDELMLRFAFMDETIGPKKSLEFLKALAGELASYIPSLRTCLGPREGHMPLSGRLALESGIQGYEALLRWARKAIAVYERKEKGRA
ncbi:MAG: PadR family transcriptional regulator [Acidobacteriia bacterium]|nr:PadR family transcriptional regulator [Terriglobia bacterium]